MFAFSLYCLDGETCVLTILLRLEGEALSLSCPSRSVLLTLWRLEVQDDWTAGSVFSLLGLWGQWWGGKNSGFLECLMKVEPSWINYLPEACAFPPPHLFETWSLLAQSGCQEEAKQKIKETLSRRVTFILWINLLSRKWPLTKLTALFQKYQSFMGAHWYPLYYT